MADRNRPTCTCPSSAGGNPPPPPPPCTCPSCAGMHDLSLSSDFCSCGRYSHHPLIACFDLFPVRGSESCPVVGSLRVPFGADLILPFLTVSLAKAQVLPQMAPIVGSQFRAQAQQVWGSGPKSPETMNL